MMTIIEAIRYTLQLKQYCTITDIVKATGMKYADVLREVVDNKHLLQINKKGYITAFVNVEAKQCNYYIRTGQAYRLVQVDQYDNRKRLIVAKDIESKLKYNIEFQGLYANRVELLLATKENLKKLAKLKVYDIETFDFVELTLEELEAIRLKDLQ